MREQFVAAPCVARGALVVALVVALGACAVGPNYVKPTPAIDAGFISAGAASVNAQAPGADIANFWRGFYKHRHKPMPMQHSSSIPQQGN